MLTIITVEVKDYNNDSLDIIALRNLVTGGNIGYCWSQGWTSTMMALMVSVALWPLIGNFSRKVRRARTRNAPLIDLMASPQVKIRALRKLHI